MLLPLPYEVTVNQISAVCDFTKSVSFRLLEAAASLILLYIVGRSIWYGLCARFYSHRSRRNHTILNLFPMAWLVF